MRASESLEQKARTACRESRYVDFKASFDQTSAGDWCEIIKDIAAMANSGGGIVVFGVADDGTLSGHDCRALLSYDPAKITDKIDKYTGSQFSSFEILQVHRGKTLVAALRIGACGELLVFDKPGSYQTPAGGRIAFQRGTVYFRHGAKSEPGNADDIRHYVDRQVDALKKSMSRDIRKVIAAPPGTRFEAVTAGANFPVEVRIVDDTKAVAVRPIDHNTTHPYRQMDVIERFNSRVPAEGRVNQYDILCVRSVYRVDQNPKFSHRPRYSVNTYSDSFIDWLVEQYSSDNQFFRETRERYDKTD